MAARNTPSRGAKPDKLMRDALILELHQEADDANGQPTKKLRLIARKLIDLAAAGDVPAIKEVNDRVDGKAPQAVDLSGSLAVSHEDSLEQLDEPAEGDTPEAQGQS